MGFVLGFLPWVLYWVLIGNVPFRVAVVVVLGVAVVVQLIGRLRRHPWRSLEVGSLVVFALLALAAFVLDDAFLQRWMQPLSNLGILLVALAGLLVGRPFVREYAAGSVDPATARTDGFAAITRGMTWLWAGIFAGMTVLSAIPPIVDGAATLTDSDDLLSILCYWVLPYLLLGLGGAISAAFPPWFEKRTGMIDQREAAEAPAVAPPAAEPPDHASGGLVLDAPARSRHDEPFPVVLHGARPGARVELTATGSDLFGRRWRSAAAFTVPESGRLEADALDPADGDWTRAAPGAPLAAMRFAAETTPELFVPPNPHWAVTLDASDGEGNQARRTVHRVPAAAGVRCQELTVSYPSGLPAGLAGAPPADGKPAASARSRPGPVTPSTGDTTVDGKPAGDPSAGDRPDVLASPLGGAAIDGKRAGDVSAVDPPGLFVPPTGDASVDSRPARGASAGGLPGLLALPAGEPPPGGWPAVACFGGSEGGFDSQVAHAELLASLGFAALAACWVPEAEAAKAIAAIPLERFTGALEFLAARPEIDGDRVAAMAVSRGAEGLLAAVCALPAAPCRGLVLVSPSSVSWQAIGGDGEVPDTPSWTVGGSAVAWRPLPTGVLMRQLVRNAWRIGRDTAEHRPTLLRLRPAYEAGLRAGGAGEIAAERAGCPLLLLTGADDAVWPSGPMADALLARRAGTGDRGIGTAGGDIVGDRRIGAAAGWGSGAAGDRSSGAAGDRSSGGVGDRTVGTVGGSPAADRRTGGVGDQSAGTAGDRHIAYPGAGHLIRLGIYPTDAQWTGGITLGGTREGQAVAQQDATREVIMFLRAVTAPARDPRSPSPAGTTSPVRP